MTDDKIITDKIISTLVIKMAEYNQGDTRRINHALKVFSFAQTIGRAEGLCPGMQFQLEMAAILHDIGIHESEKKHSSSNGKYQEIEGPVIAENFLKSLDICQECIDRVKFLVGHHHTYPAIDQLDFQILVESDFLVNIDEDQMNSAQIEAIKKNIFKTQTGIRLLNALFM